MKELIKKGETLSFAFFEDMKNFLENQESEQIVQRLWVNEMEVKPSLIDSPIFVQQTREAFDLPAEIEDSLILETMNDGVYQYIDMPTTEKRVIYPLAIEGLNTLLMRAGFKPESPAFLLKEKDSRKKLSPTAFADILNYGLSANNKKSLNIIRDNRLYASHSGGDGDYCYVEASKILDVLNNSISIYDTEFIHGEVSHEFVHALYKIHDTSLEREANELLNSLHFEGEWSLNLFFQTSDIGLSGVNIYPFLSDNKTSRKVFILREGCLSIKHRNAFTEKDGKIITSEEGRKEALLRKVEENVSISFSSFKNLSEAISEMASSKLFHPYEAVYNAITFCHFSRKTADEIATTAFASNMLDTYNAVWSAYDKYADEKKTALSLREQVSLFEVISSIPYRNYKEFDKPSTI